VLKLLSFYAIAVIDAIWECLQNFLNETVNTSGCFLGLIKFGFILINNHLPFRVNRTNNTQFLHHIFFHSINFIQIIVFKILLFFHSRYVSGTLSTNEWAFKSLQRFCQFWAHFLSIHVWLDMNMFYINKN